MSDIRKRYPDNSAIYARKARARRERAAMSFSAKLDVLDALQERLQPVIDVRKSRQLRKQTGAAE